MLGARKTGLCSPESVNRVTLPLPRFGGQFQGPVPTTGGAGDWRGDSKGRNVHSLALCRLPGSGRRGEGVVGRLGPRGRFSQAAEGRMPQEGSSSTGQRAAPRDYFPPPPPPPQSPGRSRRLQVPRDLSERATAEEDPVPPLGEVRVASPTRPSRLRSDRFSNLAALGCPLRLFLRSPGALVHLSGSSCAPSRGSSSPSFLSPRSTARRHPRLPVSASL